jgi:hypothetical protein
MNEFDRKWLRRLEMRIRVSRQAGLEFCKLIHGIGPGPPIGVPRLEKALDLAMSLDVDLAVLGINLGDEVVYPAFWLPTALRIVN